MHPGFTGLTLPASPAKSNGKVSDMPSNLYAQWRSVTCQMHTLREAAHDPPAEKILHQIWHHQRLRREEFVERLLSNRVPALAE